MSDNARDQAKAQLSSVRAMVAALNCDFEQLEYLREERANWVTESPEGVSIPNPEDWDENSGDAEELARLEAAAGDCESQDDARQRIEEDALSVEVRSSWETLGSELSPSEFRIVLCTGGPHVEIVGDLNRYNEPGSARLLFQDWFEGKQEYICDSDETADLIAYARVFYFGE